MSEKDPRTVGMIDSLDLKKDLVTPTPSVSASNEVPARMFRSLVVAGEKPKGGENEKDS